MTDSSMDLETAWRALALDVVPGGKIVRRLESPSATNVFAYVRDEIGSCRKGISIDAEGTRELVTRGIPEISGLDCKIDFAAGGKVQITVEEKHDLLHPIFVALCHDLLNITNSSKSGAIERIVSRLKLWKYFFAEKKNGLSSSQAFGLFAELEALSEEIVPRLGIESAVDSWRGPLRELHDFSIGSLGVEIKSTQAIGGINITVANERQLDESFVSNLLLLVYSIDSRNGGNGSTLPEKVSEVRRLMKENSPAALAFEDALLSSGYTDAHARLYTLKYSVADSSWFAVKGSFPRIVGSDLRPGVKNVRYQIDIDSCMPWSVSSSEINSIIQSEVNT